MKMKKRLSKDGRNKGFTLIELMVVMAIIAVLAVLIIAAIQAARNASADTQRRSNGKSIQVGLEAYYAAQSPKAYPASADGLAAINTALGSYLNPTLTDPQTGANGDQRYCYTPINQGYRLRIVMGSTSANASCSSATPPAPNESFDINP